MDKKTNILKGLSNNQLKIIALIAMTCDHVGKQLLQEFTLLQIIGRIAFPIFSFMIAEGCFYTKNRKNYLSTLASVAFVCQMVYFVAMGSLYQCVFVTFSLSVVLIYIVDNAYKSKKIKNWVTVLIGISLAWFLCEEISILFPKLGFHIDYGFWGVMLPVFIYIGVNKTQKVCLTLGGILLLALSMGGIQWFGFLAIPLLALYNGQRGNVQMKYFFYIYYPVHLVVIYILSLLI